MNNVDVKKQCEPMDYHNAIDHLYGDSAGTRGRWNKSIGHHYKTYTPKAIEYMGQSQTEWIHIDKLKVDYTYQRNEISIANVNYIAKNWDNGVYTPILVSKRNNGDYVIIDGQHRWLAANKREDMTHLKCEVNTYPSISEEAKAFFNANKMKKTMSAICQYKAILVAGDEIAKKCEEIIDGHGYIVSKRSDRGFSAVGTLQKIVRQNERAANDAFEICVQIADNEFFPQELLEGVFTLITTLAGDPLFEKSGWRDKLVGAGKQQCLKNIKSKVAETGRGGRTMWARGLLLLINKRKSKKVTWPGDAD